jgi:hypothetical protein
MNTMRGIVIDSKVKTVAVLEKKWTLVEMQEIIGGYLEAAAPAMAGMTMFVNEDGIRLALPRWEMPFILNGKAGLVPYRGNAIILGTADDEGDLTGLEKEPGESLQAFLRAEIVWE